MTVTVLATSTTQTKRREPLRVLDMATSQARTRNAPSAAPGGTGKGGGRRTRSSLDRQEKEKLGESLNGEKKRKAGIYDEDIEGFQFSRITTKKQKSTKEPELPVPEEPAPQPSPKRGRPPKKRVEEKSTSVAEPKKSSTEGTGTGKRQTRGTAKTAPEPESQPERSTRSTRKREEVEQVQVEKVPVEKKRKKGRPSKSHEEKRNGFVSPEPPQAGTSTITLPVADTPVIQRNREMRGKKSSKGSRRSSLSMRGRRASSLIDSGASNALPHKQVHTSDFYKHIAADGLPEPRRMRQLLIWCATRAMGDKPSGSRSEDESARLAARVIQEELLKEFSSNSELSNWFGREDTTPPTVVVKKVNPKNVQNQDKIKELEEQIKKLQKERHALNALLRPSSIPRLRPASKQLPNGQLADQPQAEAEAKSSPQPDDHINLSVLAPSQQQILASIDPEAAKQYQSTQSTDQPSETTTNLPPITPFSISTRLSRITSRLAPTLDSLAAGVHDIELYRSMSDAVSSRVLRICAERLEERDARNALRRLAITSDEGNGDTNAQAGQKDVPLRPRPKEDLGPILGALSRVERRL
ncbi:Mis12-Mtw1 protein family-domain-containing protein [Aspergillus pseudodeflectus]|uniref:Mis12-Mtw1 protein family-domain-containing protein n=1 Tax=Aspergillus pseudodeflectus TaxID=176178 RepID=A0ABR4KK21_9EURO